MRLFDSGPSTLARSRTIFPAYNILVVFYLHPFNSEFSTSSPYFFLIYCLHAGAQVSSLTCDKFIWRTLHISGLACAWGVMLLIDTTVFVITFLKGIQARASLHGGVLRVMLRDGGYHTATLPFRALLFTSPHLRNSVFRVSALITMHRALLGFTPSSNRVLVVINVVNILSFIVSLDFVDVPCPRKFTISKVFPVKSPLTLFWV